MQEAGEDKGEGGQLAPELPPELDETAAAQMDSREWRGRERARAGLMRGTRVAADRGRGMEVVHSYD